MRLCNVCYAEIKETNGEDICEKCRGRKSARELMESGVSEEVIIERFLEVKGERETNIEILIDKLKRDSVKYEKI